MKSLKILGVSGALVAAAVVGGTLISAVSANPAQPSNPTSGSTAVTTDTPPGTYCQTFLDAFAQNLGVDASALTPAAKDAAKATIDQAVANGDLPQAIGDAIKQRIDNANGDGCAWLSARWQAVARKAVQRGIGADMLQAAAGTLDMQPADLRSELVSGTSLKKIAQDAGVAYDTATGAIHDAAKADLDKIVAAGKMTADRETQILDRIDQALTDGKLFNGNGPLRRNGAGPLRRNGAGPLAPASSGSSAS
jgi:lambda repressor-like predicted transcriptional regulator